jgi:membrane-associated phospholipid phosphatase
MRPQVLLARLILPLLLVTKIAAADEVPASPFKVDLTLDLPLNVGSAVASLVPEMFKNELPGPSCNPSCNPASINALDRTVVGNNLAGAAVASDALLGTTVALPVALDLIDTLTSAGSGRERMRGFGGDILVLAETLSLNFLANQIVKYAVRRPRPLTYDPTMSASVRDSADAGLSFYSEHASTAFAMATSYSYLFTLRHRHSRLVLPVWLGTHLLAAATAVLRVEAGKHFWTDVIAGALAGSSVGILCTTLHRRLEGAPGSAPAGPVVRLQPLPLVGGAGLSLMLSL